MYIYIYIEYTNIYIYIQIYTYSLCDVLDILANQKPTILDAQGPEFSSKPGFRQWLGRG